MGPRDTRSTTPQGLPTLTFAHQEMQETLLAAAENGGAQAPRLSGPYYSHRPRIPKVANVDGEDK